MAQDGYAISGDRAIKVAAIVAGVLAVLFIVSQLAIPPIVENKAAGSLTENGGNADVSVSAFPAVRLLASDGKRVEVRARNLRIDLERPDPKAFEKLDGFGEVDIRIVGSRAGPFVLDRFTIERNGDGNNYDVDMAGSVTGEELAQYAGEQVGGPLGRFFGGAAGRALPGGETTLPIQANLELSSNGGQPEVESGGGTLAGFPLDPIVRIVAQAIVEQF